LEIVSGIYIGDLKAHRGLINIAKLETSSEEDGKKHDQTVAAEVDKPAIYVCFYQNYVTITYSIQNHKANPLFLVHQITEEGIYIKI
jgi:hypothetical protein